MAINGQSSGNATNEEFFKCLKSKSGVKTYGNLYDFMKTTTEKLSQEQSFYVLDLADILWKIQLWKEKLPGIVPFYAVKAHADPVLIRLFTLLGFSFDCSTKGEIEVVLRNGGKPQNIIYAHTIKPTSSLTYAKEAGVDLLTFDCEEELNKIQKFFPTARLLLRIKAENPQCTYNLSLKYGCHLEEAEHLITEAKNMDLNIVGLSFHVGALCADPAAFSTTMLNCRKLFNFAENLGLNLNLLDIGGGFFGSKEKELFFYEVSSEINKGLKKYFPDKTVNIIAEPGCYFVGSAQKNVTCILGKRSTCNNSAAQTKNGKEVKYHYFINDGYYGSFFRQFELYDIFPRPLLTKEEVSKRQVYKSAIWGQTCCCQDYISPECSFPEVHENEYLVWENMGAYGQVVASTFTMVPLPEARHVFIKNSRLQLDWIENIEEVANFIAKNAILIENEDFP